MSTTSALEEKGMSTEHLIGKEVFVYGLGYIIWDAENAEAVQELLDEIERIATTDERPRSRREVRG